MFGKKFLPVHQRLVIVVLEFHGTIVFFRKSPNQIVVVKQHYFNWVRIIFYYFEPTALFSKIRRLVIIKA